jgi:ATP phosphoribosyltransferase
MSDFPLLFALPKGRMQKGVLSLLAEAGINVRMTERGYRPLVSYPGIEAKILKPQNIIEMLHAGTRDLGFAGADWVAELQADVVELLDTQMDPVRLVAAAPVDLLVDHKLPRDRSLVIASEYEYLTKNWIEEENLNAQFVHSYGATEVFPPEDADCIVDNTSTGSTLRANNLEIIKDLMHSSTRLYAHQKAMEHPQKRDVIETLVVLIQSVLEARKRVMLELNVSPENLEAVIRALPSMREPTVAPLHGQNSGFAVKSAVPRKELPRLIPELKAHGGTDIIVTALSQIVS